MKFAEELPESTWHIDSYQAAQLNQPGFFVLNKISYPFSILLHGSFMAEWPVKSFQELDLNSLKNLKIREPEIIIIGVGSGSDSGSNLPSREFLNFAQGSKIGFEFMGTRQACRAYNLMANEGRNVLAALII